jgi:hypothetical protein
MRNLPQGEVVEKSGLVFHLIPHTHWDREWYLPLGAFRTRLVHMVDDLLDRLGAAPDYRGFLLDGQTILLEDYLAIRPERSAEVEALVSGGRLATGPWYVLADEQIPSGEALIRNLLLGGSALKDSLALESRSRAPEDRSVAARRLGGTMPVLYSPDAFGHPAILPALGLEFGIEYGVVWRGIGEVGDLFWWTAPDGRPMLVYHLPPPGYEIGAALSPSDTRLPESWREIREQLVARAMTRHVAVFVGADHHRAHPRVVALRTALAQLEAGNEVRISTLQEFLDGAALEAGDLNWISGELRDSYGYTWTLQGAHGTRLPLKRWNADLENLLGRQAEPLAALEGWRAGASGESAHGGTAATLRHAWRELVQCHFHDAICGTCSDAVARALEVRFTDVEAAAHESVRTSIDRLIGHDPDRAREHPEARGPALALWNPSARPRQGITTAELTFFRRDILVGPPGSRKPGSGPGYRPVVLRDGSGRRIPVQVIEVRPGLERIDAANHYPDQDLVDVALVAFATPTLSGTQAAILRPAPAGRALPRGGVRATARGLKNESLSAAIAANGSVTLRGDGSSAQFARLLTLESGADHGDSYTYCPPERDRPTRPRGRTIRRLVAPGPLLGAVLIQQRLTREAGRGWVDIGTTLELRSGEPLLRVTVHLDNQARDHRLRLRVPTEIVGAESLAGAQFGSIRRLPGMVRRERIEVLRGAQALPETPVTTDPAHRYVAVAREARGLAVFAPGFFEYELTSDGDLLITLLRSVGELSRPDLSCRPGHAAWPTPIPLAQCLGTSRIELALAPINADDTADPSRLERLWEDAFHGITARWVRDYCPLPGSEVGQASGFELEGDGLVFSALKPAESGDGIILRCFNARDTAVDGLLRMARAGSAVFRVRGDESHPVSLPLEDAGHRVSFRAGPRGLVTLHLRPA